MQTAREPQIGDEVRVVSGPHEGRGGVITQLRPVQVNTSDQEWYAVIAYEETNSENKKYTDHISVPTRRLKPIQ